MKYCPNCGNPLTEDSNYCKNCGVALKSINDSQLTNTNDSVVPNRKDGTEVHKSAPDTPAATGQKSAGKESFSDIINFCEPHPFDYNL